MMPVVYNYATYPALAWILAHYFYDQKHYTFLANEYFPYRLPNPKSSNPHLIYQDFYQPWRDKDDFDKTVLQSRLNLRKGVLHHAMAPPPFWESDWADHLTRICDRVDIVFFYPIVFRVRVDDIDTARLLAAGSAVSAGSHECLVQDLDTHSEVYLLFADDSSDADLSTLCTSAWQRGAPRPTSSESESALNRLLARC